MIIETGGQINEKRSKELATSLNNMIYSIFMELSEEMSKNPTDQSIKTWQLEFDNGNTLYIEVEQTSNGIKKSVTFYDCDGEERETISLQDALNVNKYTKDIENQVQQAYKGKAFKCLYGYYTEQPIDKEIIIYDEHNNKERIKIIKSKLDGILPENSIRTVVTKEEALKIFKNSEEHDYSNISSFFQNHNIKGL